MLLPKRVSELLGTEKQVFLEYRHVYADVYDISNLEVKKDERTPGFNANAGPGVKRSMPRSTTAYLVEGKFNEEHKIIAEASSKCHMLDQFDYELGRIKALQKLIGLPNLTKNAKLHLSSLNIKLGRAIKAENVANIVELTTKINTIATELARSRKSIYSSEFRELVWTAYNDRSKPIATAAPSAVSAEATVVVTPEPTV